MIKRFLFLMVLALIIIPAAARADDYAPPSVDSVKQDQGGFVIPEAARKNQENAQQEIDKKNSLELPDSEIKEAHYNEDGTIDTVLYDDGTLVKYLYERDADGNIGQVLLGSPGSVTMLFGKGDEGELVVEVYAPTPSEQTPEPTDVSRRRPMALKERVILNDIATTPVKFDFKEINKAIGDAAKLKDGALKEYEEKTASYYDEVEKGLKDSLNGLAKEGVEISAFLEKIQERDGADSENRKAIDEAVEYVYSESGNGDKGEATNEFLNFEMGLRAKILDPSRGIYDAKVADALEDVHSVIDKLLKSRLAIYMNIKKEKIDVIINLPKPSKEETEEKE